MGKNALIWFKALRVPLSVIYDVFPSGFELVFDSNVELNCVLQFFLVSKMSLENFLLPCYHLIGFLSGCSDCSIY